MPVATCKKGIKVEEKIYELINDQIYKNCVCEIDYSSAHFSLETPAKIV